MGEEIDAEVVHGLAMRISLMVGILGLGVAAGAAIGLMEVQEACIAAGGLPEPGSRITDKAIYKNSACWQSAKAMQTLANGGGIVGAVLLLGGGALDVFEEEAKEVLPV